MFTYNLHPQKDDIDAMGHINNVVYLRYAQEVAEAHWKSVASPSQQDNVLWVVLRHEIDYKKPGFLDDLLVGKTQVESANGPKTVRHVEIIRKDDDVLLAKVKTIWCAIDAGSGKPLRLTDEVMRVFLT